jgi:hypothetical protein
LWSIIAPPFIPQTVHRVGFFLLQFAQEHSHHVIVTLFWIGVISYTVTAVIVSPDVLRAIGRRHRADGHTRAALREEKWHPRSWERRKSQEEAQDRIHVRVAIAGRIACEADVCDASELCMSIEWARRAWANTLSSVEVSRNGKVIIFANGAEHDPFCRSDIAPTDLQRVDLDTLGKIPEQPLVDMMVEAWL